MVGFVCNYVFVILNTFMVLELRSFVMSSLHADVCDVVFIVFVFVMYVVWFVKGGVL